ncbi:MAG TPA: oligosaccharide flippase family protein [Blastocatellia bacterium]|nr:oligosaccharide flippase family protein [Blastocatellia bacterium]
MSKDQTAGRNSLTRRAAALAAAKTVAFALSVLMPLVLVRTLDQSEFGLYKQAFLILSSALMLFGLQVSASAYYFMPRLPEKKAQVAMNVLIFYLAVGAVVALLFAAYPRWVTLVFSGDELAEQMPVLGLAILFWLVSSFIEIAPVANGDIRAASAFIVLSQLTRTSLLLGAAVLFGTVRAVVAAAVIQGALQCAILFGYLRKEFGHFWRSFDKKLFKAQLGNALPFGLGGLAYVVQSDMHSYFVSYYFDPATFALYAVGCFQLPLFTLLLDSVGSVLIPEIARLQVEADRRAIFMLWVSAARKVAFFFMPVCAFLFLMRHEFITTLFTDSYAGAAPIFAINVAAMLLNIFLSSAVLRAFDECKYFSMKLHIMLIPVMWVSLWVGIRAGGLVGAMAAFALVQTVDVAITTAKAGHILGLKIKDLRSLAPLARTLAAVAAASLAVISIKQLLPDVRGLTALAATFAAFGGVYLAVAFVVGAVTDAEKSDLRAALVRFIRPTKVSSATQGP